MQKKQMKLTCPNSLTHSPPNDVLVYCVIEKLYRCSESQEVLVVPDVINYYINRSVKMSSSTKARIVESLDRLVEGGYLKAGYILDTSSYYNIEGGFVLFNYEALDLLLDKPGALLHYINIVKRMSLDIVVDGMRSIICKTSIESFAEDEKSSKRSILNYNETLSDLKLIYIKRGRYSFNKQDREVNAYCLYENRNLLDRFANQYVSEDSIGNFRRKVSAQYNRFKKDPGCYSTEEIVQLRIDVDKYNKEMTGLGGDYLKKVKDISIFDLTPTPSSGTV